MNNVGGMMKYDEEHYTLKEPHHTGKLHYDGVMVSNNIEVTWCQRCHGVRGMVPDSMVVLDSMVVSWCQSHGPR